MATRHATVETPLGALTLVAAGDALVGCSFPRQWYRPDGSGFGPSAVDAAQDPLLADVGRQLDEYFAGERREFQVPIATSGDPFQERVWALLREIPYGATTTYGEIAARLGDASLARDVGAAVGRNPVGVLIPCHRVIGKDGRLTGYAGGLERKAALLELEEPAEARAARLF
jgi:methylated-DNA-[protein]-cysteine S-methyltransferase